MSKRTEPHSTSWQNQHHNHCQGIVFVIGWQTFCQIPGLEIVQEILPAEGILCIQWLKMKSVEELKVVRAHKNVL